MSLFSNLTTNGLEESRDVIGGSGPLASDIYDATIKAMYVSHSQSGAMAMNMIADINGREYRETFYVTNKEGKNFFLNQNRKKCPLPGFTAVNDICLIADDRPLSEEDTEDKVLELYDFELKTNVKKTVPVVESLIGKKVALGIVQRIENKNVKQGDAYVPSAETRTFNVVDKVFHPELRLTVAEASHQKPAVFWDKWLEKNKDVVQDRRKIKDGASVPAQQNQAPAPRKSLFGK